MTPLERNTIAVVGLGTALWAGGLFVAFALQRPAPPPTPVVTSSGGTPRAADPASTPPLAGTVGMIAGPPVAATVAEIGLPTPDQKRAALEKGLPDTIAMMANQPHGRWEDRTGTVLPPPALPAGATPLPASTVTVHLKDTPIRKALTAVGKAAGVKVSVLPSWVWRQTPFPNVTLDADNRPLMEVVSELCAKTGLSATPRQGYWSPTPASLDPANPVLALHPELANDGLGPWVVSGPFLFEATQVNHTAPIGLTDVPGTTMVTIGVACDPRVVVLGQSQRLLPTVATDDAGHSLSALTPTPPRATPARTFAGFFGFGGQATMVTPDPLGPVGGSMVVPLNSPPDVGRRIAKLSVTPRFLVRTSSERMTADVGAGKGVVEQTVGGVKVTISPVQVQGTQLVTCDVTFTPVHSPVADATGLVTALQNVKPILLDANGQPLPAPQAQQQGQWGSGVKVLYYWNVWDGSGGQSNPTLTKLILDVPTGLQVVDVPIEFDDLPLP